MDQSELFKLLGAQLRRPAPARIVPQPVSIPHLDQMVSDDRVDMDDPPHAQEDANEFACVFSKETYAHNRHGCPSNSAFSLPDRWGTAARCALPRERS